MRARHVVSDETVFVYSDTAGNFVNGTTGLNATTLYNCRRFTPGEVGYQTCQLYGTELQPL